MTLNYLTQNFLEQSEFARQANISVTALEALIEKRTIPAASYRYQATGRVSSFVSDHEEKQLYHFHLKGHLAWLKSLQNLQIESQPAAQNYFLDRYNSSLRHFCQSKLGLELNAIAPEILPQFDDALRNATWGHFINGVYGVCTKEGSPEAIFVKQACVKYVEAIIAPAQRPLTETTYELLCQTVEHLDQVESEFAPHEVKASSRQRCIIDVRAKTKSFWLGGSPLSGCSGLATE